MTTGANHVEEIMTKNWAQLRRCAIGYSKLCKRHLYQASHVLVASCVARVVEKRSVRPRLWDSWLVPSSVN